MDLPRRKPPGGGLVHTASWTALLFVVCVLVSLGGGGRAEAAPSATEHQKRAADDLWKELTEGGERATDHNHWEGIVRRSADWYDPTYEDDTQHIVNVQEYYRYVLDEQEWEDEERERTQELARLMHYFFDNLGQGDATVQEGDGGHVGDRDIQKPIPGRYIVMLDSTANVETLDKTVAVLQRAHVESEGRIRAEHITPIRNLGVGFMATMNSKAVELVSMVFLNGVCTLIVHRCMWEIQFAM